MIREQLKTRLVEALKSKNETAVSTLRLINAAIKDKDIAARPAGNADGIDDTAILNLMQSMIKQRRESIDMYLKGGRPELAAAEQAEIDIIAGFLPKQMDETEMMAVIRETIEKTGAAGMKDMGKVMGALKAAYSGKMDFAAASAKIKSLLS